MREASAKRWVLALTSVASFIVVLDSQVLNVALATIRTDLHASIEQLQWTVNAYTLSMAVLLLTGAALGDRFGRRRTFVLGIALFIAASAACALAQSVGWLIAARVVQGAAAAAIMPLAIALLTVAFPPDERGKALGIFTGLTGLAVFSGPVLGGAVTQGLSWHAIFWINVPLGLIAIPLVLSRITESARPGTAFDLAGLGLVSGGVFGLVWGLVRANADGWANAGVIASLTAGALLVIAFVAWEGRAREPMVPLRLFESRAFVAGNLASFLYNAALYGTLFFLPQFFQTAQANDALGAGLRILPWTATLFVVAPLAGSVVNRIGERRLIVVGLLLQAAGIAWLAAIAAPSVAYAQLVAPLIVAGAGVSMAMPATQRAVLNAVAPADVGKASGTYSMLRFLGAIFGVALAVTAFGHAGALTSPQTFSAGFAAATGGAAILSLLGAVAGMWTSNAVGSAAVVARPRPSPAPGV